MKRREILNTDLGLAASDATSGLPSVNTASVSIALEPVERRADFQLHLQHAALITVDMQRCFVEESPVAAPQGMALLRAINALAAKCRAAGVLVIHTAHVLRSDGANSGVLAEFIPEIRNGLINEGSPAAALHQDLFVGPGDVVVKKPRFGAFVGTDLELILRAQGIDSVIICGIATNICCETTALEAAARDFRVFFLSDGTATFDLAGVPAAQLQEIACTNMSLFGQVLTVAEFERKIARCGELKIKARGRTP